MIPYGGDRPEARDQHPVPRRAPDGSGGERALGMGGGEREQPDPGGEAVLGAEAREGRQPQDVAGDARHRAGQDPPVPGTQRTGPDLANVGNRQPSWMWNFMHLYNPRSMVPESIMPSFPWMFEVLSQSPQEREKGELLIPFHQVDSLRCDFS